MMTNNLKNTQQISELESDKFEDDEFKDNKALNDQGESKGTNSVCPPSTLHLPTL